MAFPSNVALLDDFDRADGAPGAGWVTPLRTPTPLAFAISSNQLTISGAGPSEGYLVGDLGPDTEAYVTVNSLLSFATIDIYLRFSGTESTMNGYMCGVHSSTIKFYVWVDAAVTQLGVNIPFRALVAGEKLGAEIRNSLASGAVHMVLYVHDGDSWSEVGGQVDSAQTHLDAGAVGLYLTGTGALVDDYYAGTALPEDPMMDIAWPDPSSGDSGGGG